MNAEAMDLWRYQPADPETDRGVRRRAAQIYADLYGHLARDPRDEGTSGVIGRDGPFQAPPIARMGVESPAAACRRYLREWKRSLRRSARRTSSGPMPVGEVTIDADVYGRG